jgi:hypothetical protein
MSQLPHTPHTHTTHTPYFPLQKSIVLTSDNELVLLDSDPPADNSGSSLFFLYPEIFCENENHANLSLRKSLHISCFLT